MNSHDSNDQKPCMTCGLLTEVFEKRDDDKKVIFLCAKCVGKLNKCILCGGLTCCEWGTYTPKQLVEFGYYSPKSLQILREKRYALCDTCPPDKVAA